MKNYITTYDPFFDLFFAEAGKNNHNYLMDTDILNKEDHYEMLINVADVKKENIKISLDKGYLKVEISLEDKEENNEEYILRERRYGQYSRTYFVGEDIQMKHISAKLNEGVLNIRINKPNEEELNKQKYVEIQ